MTYQIALFPMTLSHLQGHSPIANLCSCDFSYSFAAGGRISTNTERRVVPLCLLFKSAMNLAFYIAYAV